MNEYFKRYTSHSKTSSLTLSRRDRDGHGLHENLPPTFPGKGKLNLWNQRLLNDKNVLKSSGNAGIVTFPGPPKGVLRPQPNPKQVRIAKIRNPKEFLR